jgi:hypothetical protein
MLPNHTPRVERFAIQLKHAGIQVVQVGQIFQQTLQPTDLLVHPAHQLVQLGRVVFRTL